MSRLGHAISLALRKVCGEAMTTPHLRTPPFKAERLKKLVSGILLNRGDADELDEGDVWILCDGGSNIKGPMLNSFCNQDGKQLTKNVHTFHIVYSEESLESRYTRVRDGAVLNQLENIFQVRRANATAASK